MVEMYEHFPVVMWIIDALIWALGAFFALVIMICKGRICKRKGNEQDT